MNKIIVTGDKIELSISNNIKDITININDNINLNLFEIREDTNSKIQYNYIINNNSNIKINKFYDTKKIKEFDIFNFNGNNSNIDYNFNSIIKDKNKIDVIIYNNKKNNINFNSNFITIKDGVLSYKIVDDKDKTKVNIINKIMNLNNKNSNIETTKIKNIKFNREYFNILKGDIIYFDNAATTLKPKVLSNTISDYYNNYSSNAHRGDYKLSLKVDKMYENTRFLVKEFINASSNKNIIFTSGTTDSLNKIVFGYFKYNLKENDEVLLTKAEHASNILPWFELADSNKINIKYIPLNDNLELTIDNLKNTITPNTKVISIAYTTNVIGDTRPLKEIIEFAHKNNILVVVDAAQAVSHHKIDVKDLDIDFLAFSAHKMYGPTGVGILYGKEELLNNMKPTIYGGGMNSIYSSNLVRVYNDIPELFEAGTPNIAGVIGFGEIIEYINDIGLDKIYNYEKELREYAISKLSTVNNIEIINPNIEGTIITFNIKDIFAQDLAIYLDKYNICVRAGNHCSKILKEIINIKNTCRISLSFYNTKEEIDRLVKVLNNPNIKDEII